MNTREKALGLGLKRLFDLLVGGGALVILSPLIALISLAIKLDDRGPVFFNQDRVGRGRKNFRCYKFRTMVLGAESIGNGLTVTENDARITRVGRLLRLWTLDEIPQLACGSVVKHRMEGEGKRWTSTGQRPCWRCARSRRATTMISVTTGGSMPARCGLASTLASRNTSPLCD